jgi:UMF1 family MFS transporter
MSGAVGPRPAVEGGPAVAAPKRALAAWAMFDWAAQPLYTLVITFLFAPYFANAVMPDPTSGQAWWGYAAAAAGVLIAIGSPILGALADAGGRRKPWIAVFAVVMAAGLAMLWMAKPSSPTSTVLIVLAAYVMAFAAAEFAAVFTNAMMPTLVPHDGLGRLSGLGFAVGYTGGLVALFVMAGLIVTNPATGKTLLGLDPVLRLDAAQREGDRLVGPFTAVWFLVFVLPFFLFVPDRPTRRAGTVGGVGSALAELGETVRELPRNRDMLLFLIARMIYADGLAAIFTFGGIYGAWVFGWQALALGIFGIVLSLAGAVGAVIGGRFDDRIGAKRVLIVSLVILLIAALGILSIDKTHVLFSVPVTPKVVGSAPFTSLAEWIYLGFAILIGFVAAPLGAASRSLLARLAPPDKMTQYFGLFAFSGKATAFAAPLAIAAVTQATGSQRIGVSVILGFILIGLLLLSGVREPKRGA